MVHRIQNPRQEWNLDLFEASRCIVRDLFMDDLISCIAHRISPVELKETPEDWIRCIWFSLGPAGYRVGRPPTHQEYLVLFSSEEEKRFSFLNWKENLHIRVMFLASPHEALARFILQNRVGT